MVWWLAALLILGPPNALLASSKDQAAASTSDQNDQTIELEDVVVNGRPLREATSDFVERVVASPSTRGAATWHDTVCIGVGNLRRAAAEALIDRISIVAESVGLRPGQPGCEPRAFILFSTDADEAARDLVDARGRGFRSGLAGADLGDRAVERFIASDQPVRWWQSSAPVNSETGVVTGRYPGRAAFSPPPTITSPADLGAYGLNSLCSRLVDSIRDDLSQVIIIVDIDQVEGVAFEQLADFLALVSLAQISPEADIGQYDSIISLFDHRETAPAGLTDWDRAFLEGLYSAQQNAQNPQSRMTAVANSMADRVRRQQREAE